MENTKTYYQYEVTRCGSTNILEDPAKVYDRPKHVGNFLKSLNFHDSEKEHCYVVALSSKLQIKGYSLVSIGSLNSLIITAREVFRPAIFCGACKIILAHNHPSGSIKPSKQDKQCYKRIYDAGCIIGIELFDFIIVAKTLNGQFKLCSFKDENIFDEVWGLAYPE